MLMLTEMRLACRSLLRQPTLTATVTLALAAGIAATTTVFAIVDTTILRGLPVTGGAEIRRVVSEDQAGRELGLSYLDVQDLQRSVKSLKGLAAYTPSRMVISDPGVAPDNVPGLYVSSAALGLLEQVPILGRSFLEDDDRPGAEAVVIIGESLWRTRYGSEPAIIGRRITVDAASAMVVGVMPGRFKFDYNSEIWIPLSQLPGLATQKRDSRVLQAFGRRAREVPVSQVEAELSTLAAGLSQSHPDTNRGIRLRSVPFTGTLTHPLAIILLGSAAFLLLVACANVANLLLVRAALRLPEVAVRVSLGATRGRLMLQMLVESTLIAIAAGALGLACAALAVHVFASSIQGIALPYWWQFTIDSRIMLFGVLSSLGSVLLFGLIPALQTSKVGLSVLLRENARTGTQSVRARRWMQSLLVAELAFTLVSLLAAGLLGRSFLALYRSDEVVDATGLFTMWVSLPPDRYSSNEQRRSFYKTIEERLGGVSDIVSVTTASALPFSGAPQYKIEVEGNPLSGASEGRAVSYVTVGDLYFQTLGVRLEAGRAFDQADGSPGRENVIVNRRFAAMFLRGNSAIGQRMRFVSEAGGQQEPWLTIIGVSPTIRQQFLQDLDPVVYVPNRMDPSLYPRLIVRGRAGASAVPRVVRRELSAIDPMLPMFLVMPMEELMGQSRWQYRIFGAMVDVFAVVSVCLSVMGVFAITAFGVAERRKEVGVRLAMGATYAEIIGMFLRGAMVPIGLGAGIGLLVAFGVARLLSSVLVQVDPADPETYVASVMVLVFMATLSVYWPARAAGRLNPVDALKRR